MTSATVLIVNFNGGALLARCLETVLAQQPPPAEIVVVDNASHDGSVATLPEGVRLVSMPRNAGYSAAVNAGLAATTAPYVLMLNPDTELFPGCLAAAVAALHADYELGSVAPRVLLAAEPTRLDAIGIGLTSRFSQLNIGHGRLDTDVPAEPRTVLGPLGGAALWRRRALKQAGLFSEDFFLYWEDVDIALRVNRAGYTCRTVPTARVLHHGSATIGRGSITNVFYMLRNHAPCLLGALPGPLLRNRCVWLILAPMRAAVLHGRRGRPFTAIAGLLCGFALFPAAYLRRRRLTRSGTSRKAADRIAALMAATDADRLAMKAAERALRAPHGHGA